MNKTNNQVPVKLCSDEFLVKKYKMYEAKQNFRKSKVFLYVTNKRVLICENKKTILSKGTKFSEYDINKIVDINTSTDDYVDLHKVLIALFIAIFLCIPFGTIGIVLGLILLIVSIILVFVFKKSDGTVKFISIDRRIVSAEVSTKRPKIFLRQEQVKFKNVKRCKDFVTLQYELGSVIKDIQNNNCDMPKVDIKKEIITDEIPDL